MAHVRSALDGGAAQVDAHLARVEGLEGAHRPGGGVVQSQGHGPRLPGRADAAPRRAWRRCSPPRPPGRTTVAARDEPFRPRIVRSSRGGRATPPGEPARRRAFGWPVYAWGLWDWGSAAFNAVITTFVFTVYLTSDAFGPGADAKLGWALAAAGRPRRRLRPGQRAARGPLGPAHALAGRQHAAGRGDVRRHVLRGALAGPTCWLGLLLLAAGNIFFEFASVNYNAMLNHIATPGDRRPGLRARLGPGVHRRHRAAARSSTSGSSAPTVGSVRDHRRRRHGRAGDHAHLRRVDAGVLPPGAAHACRDRRGRGTRAAPARTGSSRSYRLLFRSVADLWRTDRNTVYFLLASAVFRDGLAGRVHLRRRHRGRHLRLQPPGR